MKSVLVSFIIIMICFLSACQEESAKPASENNLIEAKTQEIPSSRDGLSLELEQNDYPITEKEITGIYTNHTEQELSYGKGFSVEKNIEGIWYYLQFNEDYGITDEGHLLPPGKEVKETYSLNELESAVEPGRYRVIKRFGARGIAAEFNYSSP